VTVDDNLSGEEETIESLSLEDPGIYSIIVSDYAGDGGTYLLMLDTF
jgi:hypothetical protein